MEATTFLKTKKDKTPRIALSFFHTSICQPNPMPNLARRHINMDMQFLQYRHQHTSANIPFHNRTLMEPI